FFVSPSVPSRPGLRTGGTTLGTRHRCLVCARDRASESLLPRPVATAVRFRAALRRNACRRAVRARRVVGGWGRCRDVPVWALAWEVVFQRNHHFAIPSTVSGSAAARNRRIVL